MSSDFKNHGVYMILMLRLMFTAQSCLFALIY